MAAGRNGRDARVVRAGLRQVGGLGVRRDAVRGRVRRRRLPVDHGDRGPGDVHVVEHGVVAVPTAHPGGDRRDPRPRLRRAEGDLPPEDDDRRVDRHDEPHRAAGRLRRRGRHHQGGAERRRLLEHHRTEDLHHLRRARPRRADPPPRARPHARIASRHEGHLDVPRPEVRAERRRVARRSEPGHAACRSNTSSGSTVRPPA